MNNMSRRQTTKMNKLTRQVAVLMMFFVGLALCSKTSFQDRSNREFAPEATNIGDTHKTSGESGAERPLSRSKRHNNGAGIEKADAFGSRLTDSSASAGAFNGFQGSPIDTLAMDNSLFANRQGQLAPSTDQMRRLTRQQQQQPQRMGPVGQNNQQQQPQRLRQPQQLLAPRTSQQQQVAPAPSNNVEQAVPSQQQPGDPFRSIGVDLQPRFQRLRAPPSDQFQGQNNNNNLSPFAPSAALNQNNRQVLSNNGNNGPMQQFAPTLSAFDLSSLANLASEQGGQFGPRRQQVPVSSQQQQQQQQPQPQQRNDAFRGIPGASFQQQVPNSNQPGSQPQPLNLNSPNGFIPLSGNSQTELPFVRQVFRPSNENGAEQEASSNQEERGSRPTPPPLFVPARPIPTNKVTRLVETGGFSPVQAPGAREPVFFEPSTLGNQRGANNNQRIRQPAQQSAQDERRKPPAQQVPTTPARRPGQRPLVPQQQQQQQNANVPPVQRQPAFAERAPQQVAPQQPASNVAADVIRLASNAIQAANEGLAAIVQPVSQLPPNVSSEPPVSSESPTTIPSSSTTSATAGSTSSQQPELQSVTMQPEVATNSGDSQRRTSSPRASANLLSLTSAATTSPSASSFSPALPINAAVAASGGRRRIPVRNQQSQISRQQQNQQPAATTPSSTTTTTTTAATRSSSVSGPVRRPEIEEFYETIQGNQGNSLVIDGFGGLNRSQGQNVTSPASASTTTSAPTIQNSAETTPTSDLYGSRLNAANDEAEKQQVERLDRPGQQQEQNVAATTAAAPAANSSPMPLSVAQSPVMVPVTYMTTLTYLTTVLHGTHTLETSHESVVKSTELATLDAQLMDRIEHRLPLIEPTATVSISSKTKGKGTTMINLKSAVSVYNQELVEALGATATATVPPASRIVEQPVRQATNKFKAQQQNRQKQDQESGKPLVRASRTVDLAELQEAKKSLVTKYVYLYTMRPLDGSNEIAATSVRSEMVTGTADNNELLNQLMGSAANSGGADLLVDSKGMLRLSPEAQQPMNLGSTIGKEQATEVNMNVATYIKFDDITNALLDVKPTKLATIGLDSSNAELHKQLPAAGGQAPSAHTTLETSFNVQLALSNALDKLNGDQQLTNSLVSQSGQQTPSLESVKPDANRPIDQTSDLLRSTAAANGQTASSSRAQLRSRVASSRFRQPIQSSLANPVVSASASIPSQAQVNATSATAPLASGRASMRPNKSRLARPSLKSSLGAASDSSDLSSAVSSNSQAPVASMVLQPTRTSKPRFVVVTRTGQFGVRAPSIQSSVVQQPAGSELSVSSQQIAPDASSLPASSSVRPPAGSRFIKPNRGRFTSRLAAPELIAATSVLSTPAPATQTAGTPIAAETSDTSSSQAPTTQASPAEQPAATTTTTGQQQQQPTTAESRGQSVVDTTAQLPSGGRNDQSLTTNQVQSVTQQPAANDGASQDGSVVVTYFTTTTHTIPFTISSETVFTTIEETNSRIATEYMRDLSSHFIEPTQMVTGAQPTAMPTEPQAAATTTVASTTSSSTGTNTSPPTTTSGSDTRKPIDTSMIKTTTTAPSEEQRQKESGSSMIEPKATISSATPDAPATSTPAQTTTSQQPPTDIQQPADTTTNRPQPDGSSQQPVARFELSTATVQDSALPTPALNLNSEVLGATIIASDLSGRQDEPSTVQPVDRITKTRSFYTTLTHFITFYSGSKTHLSTIQEISPTVVTEYIDRTAFEEQQQQQQQRQQQEAKVADQPVEPTQASVIVMTPSPVLDRPLATVSNEPAPTTSTTFSESSSSPVSAETASSTTTTVSSSSSTTDSEDQSTPARPDKPTDSAESQPTEARQQPTSSETFSEQPSGKSGAPQASIFELSDLMAANSSQHGRVTLNGNLGAAIKDIVQLLAGNRTATSPTLSLDTSSSLKPIVATSEQPSTEQQQPSTTTSTSTPTTSTMTTSTTNQPPLKQRPPARVFGPKAKQELQSLQGSMSSVLGSTVSTTVANEPIRATPELSRASSQSVDQSPAATIFFGNDDGGDERKKPIKSVWPAIQSTVYVTSIEPTSRLLTLTTTKVHSTRDPPVTVTASYTTLIAQRTFVSTIMGTRTLVNQLSTQAPGPVVQPATTQKPSPQAAQVLPSRQDSQAAGHRLSVQQKQQKQQAQQELLQKKAAAKAQKQQQLLAARNQPVDQQVSGQTMQGVNAAQCQPACKLSNNEVCRFQPNLDTPGAPGTYGCACRPGYQLGLNQVGQRQCLEVQSYVVLLRLLQVGDQQVAYKRELQDHSSVEYRQYSQVIKEHVKRAYMTSELTRERFVGADVMDYSRGLAQGAAGRKPTSGVSSADQVNAGVIVNITVQLQPPVGTTSEPLDENILKEELTKKLNLRQAAALAASAAKEPQTLPSTDPSGSDLNSASNATNGEMLPNPDALFLADVEQVSDLDECANPALNDCHESAVCINELGSYRCDCRDYPDLNPLHPGRQCANELKSCDYCNNRGDCLRVPSVLQSTATNSSSSGLSATSGRFSTVCQCHRFYLGRRCEINGLMLACLLPIVTILLFVSVCLVIYCCRRWRKRSALHRGFKNIGTFGPNMIGGTLDRKAMLESSSESSDTHQRSHHLRGASNGIYDTSGGLGSEPTSSSNESSPRQMARNQLVSDSSLLQPGSGGYHLESRQQSSSQQPPSLGPYCSSIPPQIVIPRARHNHNQVNYAVHRGQVYMW